MKKKLLCIVLAVAVIFSALGVTASAATVVTPTVSLNSIPNVNINTTVTVKGSATTPCYRMAAKYVHNGSTTWLGEVYSNNYSKTFTVTSAGTYTVTLYARSYPETDARSGNGSKTVSFTVYDNASYQTKADSIDEGYVMAISEVGLFATFTVKGAYTEKYKPSGNNLIYDNRRLWAQMKPNAPITNATIIYSAPSPSHVSDWAKPAGGSIYDPSYPFFKEAVSFQTKTYSRTTTAGAASTLTITSVERAFNPYAHTLRVSFGVA